MRPTLLVVLLVGALAAIVAAEDGARFRMHASADLDGDGKAEQITLTPLSRLGGTAFTLTVNGSSITDKLEYPADGFLIVDIDENDSYKEVAVHTPGPSDDDEYFYFWFDGRQLHRTGRVARWPLLLGHGVILVKDWAGFWARTKKYVLTAGHWLKPIPQQFYWVGVEGRARKQFPIYSTPKANRVQAHVRSGSTVLVVLCDCKGDYGQWHYLLKTEHGQLGWVRRPEELLLGLPLAD